MMKPLSLYNTKSRAKQEFLPIDPKCVTMYVCGPTVYNYVHIGNARPVVVFDTLFRLLNLLYPKVVYARNITDIDDKIMKAARDEGVDIEVIANRFTEAYAEDMAALNALPPSLTPKATDNLEPMIALVEALIEKGHAYESEGHVLFDVPSMEDYGALSGCDTHDMLQGARVEVASYKRFGGDFVLWKPSTEDEPGWPSPWGRGRPGWHLECSAMIRAHLGQRIDIHGGGRDLIFPHHENERAQSQCAHGSEEFVNFWMHNGFINIDGEKMSKSLGNFKTVRDLLTRYHGETLRFALLSGLYRSELDFSADLLNQAKQALDGFYGVVQKIGNEFEALDLETLESSLGFQALMDDLNTPACIAEMHQLASHLQKNPGDAQGRAEFYTLASVLGILEEKPEAWFQGEVDDSGRIESLILERNEAKKNRNWARADEIREILAKEGIQLLDSPEGTTWRKQ